GTHQRRQARPRQSCAGCDRADERGATLGSARRWRRFRGRWADHGVWSCGYVRACEPRRGHVADRLRRAGHVSARASARAPCGGEGSSRTDAVSLRGLDACALCVPDLIRAPLVVCLVATFGTILHMSAYVRYRFSPEVRGGEMNHRATADTHGWMRGASGPLRGALLGLVLERHGHGGE